MSDTGYVTTYHWSDTLAPPAFPALKEGDRLRVVQQTPEGPVERIYIAGPPVHADDSLDIKQTFMLPLPEYEVAE